MHSGISIACQPLADGQRHASWRSNKDRFRVLAILAAMLLSSTAFISADAQTLNWGAAGGGGSGTWNTAATNWFDGSTAVAWTNGDTATLGGTAGTVTVNGTVGVGGAIFNTNGYTITGGTLAITGSGLTITSASNSISTNIGSSITGSNLSVLGGSVTLSSLGAISYGGSTTVANGARLTLTAPNVSSTVQSTTFFVNGSSTLAVVSQNRINIRGTITFDQVGGGTVDFAGSGSQGGVVMSGPLTIVATGGAQDRVISSTGVGLNININTTPGSGLTLSTTGASSSLLVSAVLWNAGTLSKTGPGTAILSFANIYAGPTILNGGILSTQLLANGGAASGIGMSNSAAANLVLDGGTLQYTGTGASTDRQFTLTANGGGIDASGSGALNFTSTAAITLSGAGARALTLTGSNTGSNTLAVVLGDNGGSSSLIKAGVGRWALTASNSYTGGTVLNAGTLQVSADANLGDAAGALTFNGGTLQNTAAFSSDRAVTVNSGGGVFQTDADLTMSGVMSGSGALTKTGATALILTGANNYSGGTTISTGILQIGNGGTSGAIVGNVVNNGALVFDRSDSASLAGAISGAGSVSQIGTGATTLSGSNSYAGGTTITAGTLIGSATSFGSGAITDNAALVISQSTDSAFANAINGTGGFTKQGGSRLNYTGTGNLSGPTMVAQGLLSVNGSLAGSAVTVANGASLGGNGTVGATTVQNGGTVAPGNSIGTLHVNGAFIQNAGSIYQVEVDPNSNVSDLIAVNGTAVLQSGAGLQVVKYNPGEYQVGTVYTVLTASGGLSGTYTVSGQTTGVSAFLALKDSYDANNAYLTVVQTQPLDSAAEAPNQQAVADAVQTLPPITDPVTGATTPNPVETALLNLPDAASARAAFDQLSGQVQASAQGALLANGLYMREVAIDRLRDVICTPDAARLTDNRQFDCDAKKLSVWGQGFGGWGGIAGNGNATGLNHSAAGFLVGVDVPVEDVRLGVFGGASHGDFHLAGGGAGGESKDYHLGLYGGTVLDDVALRLGASYSWNGITTDRAVQIGSFSDALHGVYNAGTIQAFGELGYGLALDWGSLEPFVNLAYVSLHTAGFTEAGGPAALTVRASTIDDTITTLGVRPSTGIALGGLEGVLRGMVGWRHTFGTVAPVSVVSFAGGNPFGVSGAPIARDAAAVEAGLDVSLEEGLTLGLTYGGQFSGRRTTDQMARGTIRISF